MDRRAASDDARGLAGTRRETAEELLRRAGVAADRIEAGIDAARDDADALDAFRIANRAVAARAAAAASDIDEPRWRPFQLAFLLMNLPGIADPSDADREVVDLLFFPTGGGKTEAYLGLAAFTLVLRRLRHPGDGLAGAGVSVLMRYTLRLLTLDQLARAAAWSAPWSSSASRTPTRSATGRSRSACGSARPRRPTRSGARATAARTRRAPKVRQFKNDPKRKPSPIPLENCPWCGTKFEPDSFTLLPERRPARATCASSASTSSATSPATARCRSSPWTSRSTAGSRLPDRHRGQVRGAAVDRASRAASRRVPTATTPTGFYGAAEPGQRHARCRRRCCRRTSSSRTSCT